MGEDGPTDVLSFPMLQPDAFPRHAGQHADGSRARHASLRFSLPPDGGPTSAIS